MKIILTGKAGSGKDTVAEYLVRRYRFKQYAFADFLKEIAQRLFPVEYQHDRRDLLQRLGAKMRGIRKGCWVMYLLNKIRDEDFDRVIVTDCRYENEYSTFKGAGFAPVEIRCDDKIRSERLYKRDGRALTEAELNHESEKLQVNCRYVINNNGDFEDLYEQVDRLYKNIWTQDNLAEMSKSLKGVD